MCDFTPEASLIPGTASQRKSQYHKIDLLLFLNPILNFPFLNYNRSTCLSLTKLLDGAKWPPFVHASLDHYISPLLLFCKFTLVLR